MPVSRWLTELPSWMRKRPSQTPVLPSRQAFRPRWTQARNPKPTRVRRRWTPRQIATNACSVATRRYWLMKTEPDVFSIRDLQQRKTSPWDGVRNYRARNLMKDEMQVGDLVLFYHSNAEPPGVAGISRVCSASYPDPTQFDRGSEYFDPKSTPEAPRWWLVDVEFVEELPKFLPLPELRAMAELDGMMLLQKGTRLSVQPVQKKHFQWILKCGRAHTKVR